MSVGRNAIGEQPIGGDSKGSTNNVTATPRTRMVTSKADPVDAPEAR